MDIKPVKTLNVKELSCPMPLIQTKRELSKINTGEVLEVLCDYPESGDNVPVWCEKHGHVFLGDMKETDFIRLFIQKG